MQPRDLRIGPAWAVVCLLHPAPCQDPAAEPPAPAALGYDGGFFVRSPDGRHELRLEGLLQVGLNVYERDPPRASELDLRRLRPELAGRIADFLRFRLEPNLREDGVELEEAWIGAELGASTLLMLGRMKAPFSLEEVRSRRHIDFPRFSILNQLVPAEDHGVFLNGRAGDEVLEYGVAVYNGTGGADTNGSKDVAARLMVHPFLHNEESPLRHLQLGVAATWGRQRESVAGRTIVNAFAQPVLELAPAAMLDGERMRLGLEAAWFRGPLMAQSEAILVRQEMRGAGVQDDVQMHGAYVSAAVVLTGEDKSFAGVRPRSPVRLPEGTGTGAWVLAARVSDLRADSALRGLTEAGRFTRDIRSVSVGVNWILNEHALVRHAYVHSFYSDDVTIGGRTFDHEGALMIEWQVMF